MHDCKYEILCIITFLLYNYHGIRYSNTLKGEGFPLDTTEILWWKTIRCRILNG